VPSFVAKQASIRTPLLSGEVVFQETFEAEWVIGAGKRWVYGYWIPEVERVALASGKTVWCIKIGKTNRANPLTRILEQAFVFEPKVVAIRTDHPDYVENLLLTAFPFVEGVRSVECRNTNPDLIREVYEQNPVERVIRRTT